MGIEYYLVIDEKKEFFELGKGPWYYLDYEFSVNHQSHLEFDHFSFFKLVTTFFNISNIWRDIQYVSILSTRISIWKEIYLPYLIGDNNNVFPYIQNNYTLVGTRYGLQNSFDKKKLTKFEFINGFKLES